MHYRKLGRTGVIVSEVGFGGNRLGEAYAGDDHWVDLVRHAADLGVTLFDTAEAYGWGRSEEVLGKAFRNRSDVVIATKMCRVARPRACFPRSHDETAEGSCAVYTRAIDIFSCIVQPQAGERFGWVEAWTG